LNLVKSRRNITMLACSRFSISDLSIPSRMATLRVTIGAHHAGIIYLAIKVSSPLAVRTRAQRETVLECDTYSTLLPPLSYKLPQLWLALPQARLLAVPLLNRFDVSSSLF
jgi:hypothetical protein